MASFAEETTDPRLDQVRSTVARITALAGAWIHEKAEHANHLGFDERLRLRRLVDDVLSGRGTGNLAKGFDAGFAERERVNDMLSLPSPWVIPPRPPTPGEQIVLQLRKQGWSRYAIERELFRTEIHDEAAAAMLSQLPDNDADRRHPAEGLADTLSEAWRGCCLLKNSEEKSKTRSDAGMPCDESHCEQRRADAVSSLEVALTAIEGVDPLLTPVKGARPIEIAADLKPTLTELWAIVSSLQPLNDRFVGLLNAIADGQLKLRNLLFAPETPRASADLSGTSTKDSPATPPSGSGGLESRHGEETARLRERFLDLERRFCRAAEPTDLADMADTAFSLLREAGMYLRDALEDGVLPDPKQQLQAAQSDIEADRRMAALPNHKRAHRGVHESLFLDPYCRLFNSYADDQLATEVELPVQGLSYSDTRGLTASQHRVVLVTRVQAVARCCAELARRVQAVTTRTPPLQPRADVPARPSLVLRGRYIGPIVCGIEKQPLTDAQYDIIKALIAAGERGLTKDLLVRQSGRGDAVNTLKALVRSDSVWTGICPLPGKSGKGYRLVGEISDGSTPTHTHPHS